MTSLISYAQNFEDVMLWRALKNVENGFYIDLGAQDPVVDSVSLAFHEHGWTGIHVEPTPHYAQLLRSQRPGDTVIEAAVGNEPGLITFFEIPHTGISTGDPQIAQQHREKGFEVREITVPCVRLSSVFKNCETLDIHWMKIDVEGFEWSALASWGKAAARPWIVVVESTLPTTQIESHQRWEPMLLRRDYTPVYFDGLNRYYISKKHPELFAAFLSGPNIFDGFTFNGTSSVAFWATVEQRYKLKLAASAAERKQEMATQLLALQQQAEQEKAEQERGHREQEGALQRAYAERELVFAQQLHAGQHDLRHLDQERATREQDVAAQLLAVHQQAEKERAEQARGHSEQEGERQRAYAEREQSLIQQLLAGKQELETQLLKLAQREREITEQLVAIQQDSKRQLESVSQSAAAENVQLRNDHAEKLAILQQQLADSERETVVHKLTMEQEAAHRLGIIYREAEEKTVILMRSHEAKVSVLQQALVTRERANGEHLIALQKEVLSATHKIQSESENRMLLLSRKHDEGLLFLRQEAQKRECFLHTALESAMGSVNELRQQAEILSERHRLDAVERDHHFQRVLDVNAERERKLRTQVNHLHDARDNLQKIVYRLRVETIALRFSWSWRVTAPARWLARHMFSRKEIDNDTSADLTVPEFQSELDVVPSAVDPISSPASTMSENAMQSTPISVQTETVESATVHNGLHSTDDLEFLRSAYELVLGRSADPDGSANYLGQLRGGDSRLYVLALLRLSTEGIEYAANRPQLDDELAIATSARAVVTTFEELVGLQGQEFVQAAYIMLLGRKPDAEGMDNCVAQMRNGAAKGEILEQLRESPEWHSRTANAKEILDVVRRFRASGAVPSETSVALLESQEDQPLSMVPTIKQLLTCDEQEFVQLAFRVFLERRPDPKAFGTYLNHLAAGVTRMQLLADISISPEAINRARFVARIETAIRRHRLAKIPFIGAIACIFSADIERQDQASRTLRAQTFESLLWRERLERRISVTEGEINSIKRQLLKTAANISNARAQIADDAPDGRRSSAGASPRVHGDLALSSAILMKSREEAQPTSFKLQRPVDPRDTFVERDPHVLEVLSALQAALISAKKSSNENCN